MAINGVEMALNQVWETRAGDRVRLAGFSPGKIFEWIDSGGLTYQDSGKCGYVNKQAGDLVRLISQTVYASEYSSPFPTLVGDSTQATTFGPISANDSGVGDINSDAKGSGARFNTGKVPYELVPLEVMAMHYDRMLQIGCDFHLSPDCTPLDAVNAILSLGNYQANRVDSDLIDVLVELGDGWEECARVFDYGRKKYSKRGDCTCNASDAIRMRNLTSTSTHTTVPTPGRPYEGCVSGVTTKISKSGILDTESDKPPTIENGWKIQTTATELGTVSASAPLSADWTQPTKSQASTNVSEVSTDCHASNTMPLCPKAAAFAEASPNFMSTTATLTDRCDQLSAIPATLALDLSKGLETGLAAHSSTCGVHQMPGQTGNWNWAKGMAWSIPIACAARHLLAMSRGEVNDPESGLPHRGHVFCNICMLVVFAETFQEGDDRPAPGLLAANDDEVAL